MTKKELIIKVLESLGLKPQEDGDGDLEFFYQMKKIFAIVGEESEQYLVLIMPQFSGIEDGEEHIALATCNKITRELKLVKVYVEQTFKNVSANSEFCYTDEESMKNSIENSLRILGVVRTLYRNTKKDFIEQSL